MATSPNRWSCLPTAFAMICKVPVKIFISKLGHDGSEILWPDLGEPRRRKSFHLQECLKVSAEVYYRFFCQFDMNPVATADGKRTYTLDHTDFVNQMMEEYDGILLGSGQSNLHAVAWMGDLVYDSNGEIYKLPSRIFTPRTFLACTSRGYHRFPKLGKMPLI